LIPQREAATNATAGTLYRIQDRLTALRSFFAEMEPKLPAIFALSYRRLFEVEPALAGYFKGGIREHLPHIFIKIQSVVKTTRSSQLWPAGAATGQMLIPEVAALGRNHAKYGVQPAHFSLMNDMLAWTCKEVAFEEFTPLVEEGLAFVFDVLAASLTVKGDGGDVLSKLRSRFSAPTLLNPTAYFDEEETTSSAA
jgi:hemoglobin-like flavoprotein